MTLDHRFARTFSASQSPPAARNALPTLSCRVAAPDTFHDEGLKRLKGCCFVYAVILVLSKSAEISI
jgi:hypothetical protein